MYVKQAKTTEALEPQPLRKYTVLLYLNGRNNLAPYMARRLVDLEALGSDANINLVAQLGILQLTPERTNRDPIYPYNVRWEGVRRFYVKKNTRKPVTGVAASAQLETLTADMGDYKTLRDFIAWGKKYFPAERTVLVVSSHGSGWLDLKKQSVEKGISPDDTTGNYITTPQIGEALAGAGGVDVFIMDDCLMQSAEVAAEIGTAARYVIGSEEVGWTNHFRADILFAGLKQRPDLTVKEFVGDYMQAYRTHTVSIWNNTGRTPSTQSAIDTSKRAEFEAAVKRYAEASAELLQDYRFKAPFKNALAKVSRYSMPFFADLYNFVELAEKGVQSKIDSGAVAQSTGTTVFFTASADLKDKIVYEFAPINSTTGNYSRSYGVSVYLPRIKPGTEGGMQSVYQVLLPGPLETPYEDFVFNKNTGWKAFTETLVRRLSNR